MIVMLVMQSVVHNILMTDKHEQCQDIKVE